MPLTFWTIAKRIDRGLMAYRLYLILLTTFSLNAALAAESPELPPSITRNGSIRQISQDPRNGYQLEVDSAQGAIVAGLGSRLSPELKQHLAPGATIQLSGTMQTIDGKQNLAVRTITIDGRQTAIRNDHGFLLNSTPNARTRENQTTAYRSSK